MRYALTQQFPTTLARLKAREEYHEACERLANASVAKHRADVEFAAAMERYNTAHGAAKSQEVIES